MSDREPYDIAVGLLARREHSRCELERKLSERGQEADEVSAALDQLRDAGLQSDVRFVEMFIRSRIERGQGPVRIRADLARRGVDSSLISEGLLAAEDDIDWTTLAREALERRWPQPPGDRREQAKAMRFLAQRGFPSDIVYALFD